MECERCKGDFDASKLRVDRKGQRLVCDDCSTFIKTGMLVPEKVKQEAKKEFSEVRKKLALSTAERLEKLGEKKERYECKDCDYKFSSIQNFKGRCPYCGEEGVKPYVEKSSVMEIDEFV